MIAIRGSRHYSVNLRLKFLDYDGMLRKVVEDRSERRCNRLAARSNDRI